MAILIGDFVGDHPRIIFIWGGRVGHLPTSMGNFVPKYLKWPGHATHGTFWTQICLSEQGFDDNRRKCLIYVAEIMAIYGLIWLNISISEALFDSIFPFTQHILEVYTESRVRKSNFTFSPGFPRFIFDFGVCEGHLPTLNTQRDLVTLLTRNLWPNFDYCT